MELPKEITNYIGRKIKASGNLFSKKHLPEDEYEVLNVRMSSSIIKDINNKNDKGRRSFELLLKNHKIQKARWTKPFAIN